VQVAQDRDVGDAVAAPEIAQAAFAITGEAYRAEALPVERHPTIP